MPMQIMAAVFNGVTYYELGEIWAVWGGLFLVVNFFFFFGWKAHYKGLAAWFAQRHGFRAPYHTPLTVREAELLVRRIKSKLTEVSTNVDKIQANPLQDCQKEMISKALNYVVKENEVGLVILLDEYGLKCTISARGDDDVIVDFDFDINNPQPPKRWGQKRRFNIFSTLWGLWF